MEQPIALVAPPSTPPFRAGDAIAPSAFARIRRRLVLDYCKWDPQVGDISTLADFPLLLSRSEWTKLSAAAERLAAETLAAQSEMLRRPDLHSELAIPSPLRHLFRAVDRLGETPAAARTMRFDFHWTPDGWRISEVNSDVPGGFTESSSFAALMAAQSPGSETAGDPAAAWADTLADSAGEHGTVALLSAAGYMEDLQIVSYIADRLRERGCIAHLASPHQLRWNAGRASLETRWHAGPVHAIVRFFQGEWLAGLPRRIGWRPLFVGGKTPVANPGAAMLTESKRFPLVWDRLATPLPTWRALLPETRDPRHAPWRTDDRWLLKSALCNNGDDVVVRGVTDEKSWRSASRRAAWRPSNWIAQRRFECIPVATPLGPMNPCIGVHTVNGKTAGIYGRLSRGPVVDYRAVDVAVLIGTDEPEEARW